MFQCLSTDKLVGFRDIRNMEGYKCKLQSVGEKVV